MENIRQRQIKYITIDVTKYNKQKLILQSCKKINITMHHFYLCSPSFGTNNIHR